MKPENNQLVWSGDKHTVRPPVQEEGMFEHTGLVGLAVEQQQFALDIRLV